VTTAPATAAGRPSTVRFRRKLPAVYNRYVREAEAHLDDVYTSYVFTPVLSVSASYRLF